MNLPNANLSRRGLLAGTGALAATTALAACNKDGSSDSSASSDAFNEKGPITLATGKDTTGKLNQLLDAWNKAHPDEKVTLTELPESADDQRTQLINNAQAKSDAFTVLGLDVVWTAEFAANQWVVALPEDKFPLDTLIPATVETGKYFKKLYAVPFATNAELLWYRKDLLEAAGFNEAPKTFDEMYQMIEKVQAKNSGIGGYGSQFSKYEGLTCQVTSAVKSAGGDLFDADGKPHADADQAVKGIQTLVDGIKKGLIPKEAQTYKEEESRQAFQDGRLVFLTNWPYVWDKFQATDGSSKVAGKVGVSPLPGMGAAGASTLGGLNYGISAFAKNKGTAVDFIAYMVAAEQQKAWALATGQAAANKDVYDDADVKKKFAFIDQLKAGVDSGVGRPAVVKYAQVTQDIQDAAYNCLWSGKDVKSTLADLQTKLTADTQS